MRHGPFLARLVFSNERARFPHVSDFPLFPNNYSESVEKFPNFHLSPKISRFSSARISDDRRSFLAIDHKFRIPPTFAISIHFSPISGNEELRKFFISPYFSKFPLHWFLKIYVFFNILSVFFVSPLLWPFWPTFHTMYVLDASATNCSHTVNGCYV